MAVRSILFARVKVVSILANRSFSNKSIFSKIQPQIRISKRSYSSIYSAIIEQNDVLVRKEEVVRFVTDCLAKVGATNEDAKIVADHLMIADYRGHFSHGLNRLIMYVKDIQTKITNPKAIPSVVTDFQAIALVDGKNGLGQVIGKKCMELAIDKARQFGIGMVSARGSNHYGICGYYTLMAVDQGMIGFNCTNTSPLVVPTRGKQTALGTNPLSLGMAGNDQDQFVLDMATSAAALGKIELAARKKVKIPEGWALDHTGEVTTNADAALKACSLLPLGGVEQTSGYKGYGLAMMVEVLCGILSGSNYGPNIRNWKETSEVANLGHCFMAINPEAFGTGSKERLSHLMKQLRSLRSFRDDVLVAGDPEKAAMAKVNRDGGISYVMHQIKELETLSKELGITPLKLSRKDTPINSGDFPKSAAFESV